MSAVPQTVHVEGALRFTFDGDWRTLKWDDHAAYIEGVRCLETTKAVDFTGHRRAQAWLIEVKDFRGHRIENKVRLSTGDLATEVACKVRDTIAGVVWACEREHDRGRSVSKLAKALFERDEKVSVVLWLEQDLPLHPGEATALSSLIKKQLHWLNARVIVTCLAFEREQIIDGLVVTNLPHAAQAQP